ncbi:MAG: hypothetical protein H0X39_05650 [Actinobacteria bacterium]|nr:hypothetical protein [Actinomycetota bacterium]
MSDDREKKIKQSDEEQLDTPDVEAHKKAGRLANDEDGGDDVQAHVKAARGANDDGGDDVEAHVKTRL